MLEYLNFLLLCILLALISYMYFQTKRYIAFLKMAEDNVNFIFGGESPQSETKRQKLLECVLTGDSKLYLDKTYTEDQLKKISEEEVEKLFDNYEAKLSGQMVKSLG